jgi:hypothetical protein
MKAPTLRSAAVRATLQTVAVGLVLALTAMFAGDLIVHKALDPFYRNISEQAWAALGLAPSQEPSYLQMPSFAAWPLELQLRFSSCFGILASVAYGAYRAPRLLRPVSPPLPRRLLTVLTYCALTGLTYALLRIGLGVQSCMDDLLFDSPRCPPVEVFVVRACVLVASYLTLLFPSFLALLLAMFGFLPIRRAAERWLGLFFAVALPLLLSATIEFDSFQLITLPVVVVIYVAAILLAPLTSPAASRPTHI